MTREQLSQLHHYSLKGRQAISLDAKYFASRQAGKNDRLLLAQFGWYTIRTPSLWGVLNKARLINLEVNTHEENGELLLTIKLPEQADTS